MLRRAFLRRMAFAAAACAFIDVPWPKVQEAQAVEVTHALTDEGWYVDLDGVRFWPRENRMDKPSGVGAGWAPLDNGWYHLFVQRDDGLTSSIVVRPAPYPSPGHHDLSFGPMRLRVPDGAIVTSGKVVRGSRTMEEMRALA